MSEPSPENGIPLRNLFIQPFPIHFDSHDIHVMLYMKGHSEYESVEAMIRENRDGTQHIRVIMTFLDGTQVDHVNDSDTVQRLKNSGRRRQVHHTPILYQRSLTGKKGNVHVHLSFTTFRGEEVVFDLDTAAPASTRRIALIDPGCHSLHSSLPVMVPGKTTLAGRKSRLSICGINFRIPVKIWIPFLFKGMKGYYSEGFHIGVLRAGIGQTKILGAPIALQPGESWVYDTAGSKAIYEITERDGNILTIRGPGTTIIAEVDEDGLSVKRIGLDSTTGAGETTTYALGFSPSVPVYKSRSMPQECEADFDISIGRRDRLVSGTLHTVTDEACMRMALIPEQPDWAAKRPVYMVLEMPEDGRITVRTEMMSGRDFDGKFHF